MPQVPTDQVPGVQEWACLIPQVHTWVPMAQLYHVVGWLSLDWVRGKGQTDMDWPTCRVEEVLVVPQYLQPHYYYLIGRHPYSPKSKKVKSEEKKNQPPIHTHTHIHTLHRNKPQTALHKREEKWEEMVPGYNTCAV